MFYPETTLENAGYTIIRDYRLPKTILTVCGWGGVLEMVFSSRVISYHAKALGLSCSPHTQKWNSFKYIFLSLSLSQSRGPDFPSRWTLALVFGQTRSSGCQKHLKSGSLYLSTNKTQCLLHKKSSSTWNGPLSILPPRASASLSVRAW